MSSLFADRYSKNGEPRRGGMADVYQAFDTQRFQQVALKIFARGRLEDEILTEAFEREIRALQELRHPGIVLLLDSGSDGASGQQYVSLEWVASDLSSLPRPACKSWESFYSEIGRPILEALAYAHSRGVVHRDIKPQNVLMGSDGPKLADFGISKLKHWLEPSITLNQFQSRPFAAPEPNDGSHEFARDVFSFAALAVQCLSAELLLEYKDLRENLDACSLPLDVLDILRSCLSSDPLDRLANAQVLLSELNALSQSDVNSQAAATYYFALSRTALENLVQLGIGRTENVIASELAHDLSGIVAFERRRASDPESTPQFSLYGSHFSYHVAISRRDPGQLVIINARKTSADALERRREVALKVPVAARFSSPQDRTASELTLLRLQEDLDAHEALRQVRQAQQQEEQLFGTWAKLLSLKEQIEQQKRDPLRYDSWSVDGNRILFSLIDEPASHVLGQERRVDVGSEVLVTGEVQDIEGGRLTLRVDRGTIPSLPRNGELLLDDRAARKAIQRQRSALDAVRYGRSARKDLRQLLLNPQECRLSPLVKEVPFKNSDLDEAKREAVRKALSTRDVLVVEGPPGTGKTTFITELILQILSATPTARILISSQTHVALDNVLENLQVEDQGIRAIRIARAGNERVSKAVQSLLLDEQMERWARQVIASSRKYLERWADEHGMSRHDFEVSQALREIASIDISMRAADEQYRRLSESTLVRSPNVVAKVSDDSPDTDDVLEQLESYRTDAEKLRRQREKVVTTLVALEPDAAELIDKPGKELNEWAETYMPTSESAAQFRKLLDLQNEWHTRLLRGSDFEAALIASSQVVAGTCIGIAAARGVVDGEFDYCIVDEASKATPTELLVPAAVGKRIVLVGDTKQLPPFIEDDLRDLLRKSEDPDLAAAGRETLFARMNDLLPTECKALLSQQHRMVPEIGDLISKCFYRETLSSAPKPWDPVLRVALPRPVTWLTTSARDDRHEQPLASGYKNPAEVRVIQDLLQQIEQILQRARRPIRALVITGYREQQVAIERALSSNIDKFKWLEVEINTVDAVQGRQADIAIYSVVRSNQQRRLGFLRESRRLNVALSRGRQYLVIVGDHIFCREADGENPFYDVASYIESHKTDCHFMEAR